jgi:hypothetical protein
MRMSRAGKAYGVEMQAGQQLEMPLTQWAMS